MKTRQLPAAVSGKAMFGMGPSKEDFRVSFTPSNSGRFDIFLFDEIEEPGQFRNAIEALEAAGEDDLVVIHLSTPGGNLDATDGFIHAMRECRGRVQVKATGGVHSAGSIILMNAEEFSLSENFNCLIHNGSCGPSGKYSDWLSATNHTKEYMERVMRNTYAGFLTDDEMEDLLHGRDFWIDGAEWMERWYKRLEWLKKNSQEGLDSLDETEVE